MDIAPLAADLASPLAPLVPLLTQGGEKAAEALGEKLGQAGWEQVRAIWDKLHGRLGADSDALQELALTPDDADAQAALRVAVKRLLLSDPILRDELADLRNQSKSAAVTAVGIRGNGNVIAQGAGAVAAGPGSVVVGGSVRGSTINAGHRE
ncbi:hypothetical protein [Candidatus Thiodictyon syntrophicum]|jgi:hypothetical protein|uniref:Uncharacterized protein n=1 Tax=Candidatus Thiodictyon syntrophicum TaxID=1166950 RepID=A0A2K8UF91_9GAMM|nr:hypothetical protein [Candidatus Thiodictyon syntrophicum]AUB84226.1 hypothetical protein THSYN_27010 [Candidatus Thiodictyon syntrophicum]